MHEGMPHLARPGWLHAGLTHVVPEGMLLEYCPAASCCRPCADALLLGRVHCPAETPLTLILQMQRNGHRKTKLWCQDWTGSVPVHISVVNGRLNVSEGRYGAVHQLGS